MNFFHNKVNNLRGFTLLEVMVTVGVFAMLTVLTYTSYPRLNNVLALNLGVQDVSSRLKSAQLKGSSAGGDYRGYGIYFSKNSSDNYFTTGFYDRESQTINALGIQDTDRYFYIDLTDPLNPRNDKIDNTELLRNNVFVSDVCIKELGLSKICGKTNLSISYVRPSTQANITDYTEDLSGNKIFYEVGYIELTSPKIAGDAGVRCVSVYRNGQFGALLGKCQNN